MEGSAGPVLRPVGCGEFASHVATAARSGNVARSDTAQVVEGVAHLEYAVEATSTSAAVEERHIAALAQAAARYAALQTDVARAQSAHATAQAETVRVLAQHSQAQVEASALKTALQKATTQFKTLQQGVEIAQNKGAFSLEEAATIWAAVQAFYSMFEQPKP